MQEAYQVQQTITPYHFSLSNVQLLNRFVLAHHKLQLFQARQTCQLDSALIFAQPLYASTFISPCISLS